MIPMRKQLLASVGVALLIVGCRKPEVPIEPMKDYGRPLPEGELALRKIPEEDWPDFSPAYYNRNRLAEAVENSLDYLAKPSSERFFPYGDVSHDRAVASLERFLEVLDEARGPEELNEAIRRNYEVYQSVGCDGEGTVYYTGYYTPIFDGRKQRDARFRYPLFRTPPDLVKDPDGRILGRALPGGGYGPYDTRRQIEESSRFEGQEIAWLADPFEAYVVTVQGNAKLRLEDGTIFEIGYAANNGHTYTPVGRILVEDGHIPSDRLSLQTMMEFFRRNPNRIHEYCWRNDRYVFFKETTGGPFGSINVPVTPWRSIATDKEVFPRACIAFLDTQVPVLDPGGVRLAPYRGFALDHDTGGAIRAAGRCDVYMGVGDRAAALAGRIGAEGRLYYIFIRPEMMR